jgi:hypothetical protein
MIHLSILGGFVIYRFPPSNLIDFFELPGPEKSYVFRIKDEGMNGWVLGTSRKFSWYGDE